MSLKASPVTLIPSSAEQGLTVTEHWRVTRGTGRLFHEFSGEETHTVISKKGRWRGVR